VVVNKGEIVDIATPAFVKHCQHCKPTFDWIENTEGKPPEVAFTGFPKDGAMVLSKKTVIVICARCSLGEGMVLQELRAVERQ
jgi:hypothetical protein